VPARSSPALALVAHELRDRAAPSPASWRHVQILAVVAHSSRPSSRRRWCSHATEVGASSRRRLGASRRATPPTPSRENGVLALGEAGIKGASFQAPPAHGSPPAPLLLAFVSVLLFRGRVFELPFRLPCPRRISSSPLALCLILRCGGSFYPLALDGGHPSMKRTVDSGPFACAGNIVGELRHRTRRPGNEPLCGLASSVESVSLVFSTPFRSPCAWSSCSRWRRKARKSGNDFSEVGDPGRQRWAAGRRAPRAGRTYRASGAEP
jgi:hypothetical protein